MPFYNQILGLHIVAGTIALITFWIVAAMRKGTPLHTRMGQVYLLAMAGVCVTAAGLAIAFFQAHKPVVGTFLSYLVVITATPAWLAWRAIRDKHDIARFAGPVYRALAWLNLAAATAVVIVGVGSQAMLLAAASIVGFVGGGFMLMFAARKTNDRRWWLVQHYGSILGCATATHIAFFVIGLRSMLPANLAPYAPIVGAIVPFVVSFAARYWLDRRYGPRRAPVAAVPQIERVAEAVAQARRAA